MAPRLSAEIVPAPIPQIDALSRPLTRMFKLLVAHPERWFTVAELMQAGVSRATIYRRGGNLVAARVMLRRRRQDQAEFRLHPDWSDVRLGVDLAARARAISGDAAGADGGDLLT